MLYFLIPIFLMVGDCTSKFELTVCISFNLYDFVQRRVYVTITVVLAFGFFENAKLMLAVQQSVETHPYIYTLTVQ